MNFIRDFKASIRNIIGGRSGSYENEAAVGTAVRKSGIPKSIRRLDTGHDLEGWPSDALRYDPAGLINDDAEE